MKNPFYFMLKALFVLEILTFLTLSLNDVLKFRTIIEFESYWIVICLSFIYLIINLRN